MPRAGSPRSPSVRGRGQRRAPRPPQRAGSRSATLGRSRLWITATSPSGAPPAESSNATTRHPGASAGSPSVRARTAASPGPRTPVRAGTTGRQPHLARNAVPAASRRVTLASHGRPSLLPARAPNSAEPAPRRRHPAATLTATMSIRGVERALEERPRADERAPLGRDRPSVATRVRRTSVGSCPHDARSSASTGPSSAAAKGRISTTVHAWPGLTGSDRPLPKVLPPAPKCPLHAAASHCLPRREQTDELTDNLGRGYGEKVGRLRDHDHAAVGRCTYTDMLREPIAPRTVEQEKIVPVMGD